MQKTIGKVGLVSEYPPPNAGMTVLANEHLTRMLSADIDIVPIVTNRKLPALLEKIRGLKGLLKLLAFILDCRKILSCRIIHIFSSSGLNFYLFTLIPMFIARLAGKKIIMHYHGGGAGDFFADNRGVLTYAVKRSSAFIVPSGYLQATFRKFGHESNIIPNFANVERFSYRLREQVKPIVLSVRNLTPVYNIACAVKAFSHLQKFFPDAKMYILGDGPERGAIESQIKSLKLNHVELVGNVPNEEVASYFEKSDILINTPVIDNMPGSILEAYASGVMVVSTSVGGIPYILSDGETGLLADSNDDVALAEHMKKLLEQPELANKISLQAKAYVDDLAWEKIKRQWLKVYQELS
ncbi:glycosyltransferase family 4 protein [Aliikangiella sp. G2MR2-5]|uniref:glycosyltransferase family 4 protein n=1 Tax=Aliikangiella sp. G2MR2-5 TaxID=2788943 RepID=UPI0018AADE7D|nr:glycosyltransferase family 4 protein [Aliikangiella sp. G2MR2-5]